MSNKPNDLHNGEAQQRIGQFLQSFHLMEAALDDAVFRLLDLRTAAAARLCAQMPFEKKSSTFISMQYQRAAAPDPLRDDLIRQTEAGMGALKSHMAIFANHAFTAGADGDLVFHGVASDHTLGARDKAYDEYAIEQLCDDCALCAAGIRDLMSDEDRAAASTGPGTVGLIPFLLS